MTSGTTRPPSTSVKHPGPFQRSPFTMIATTHRRHPAVAAGPMTGILTHRRSYDARRPTSSPGCPVALRRVRGFSLAALKAGEPTAWAWLVAEYSGKVTGYAARMGARDPEEVTSATLEALARRIGDFEGGESQFRSFVFSIAHARIVDDIRRATRRSEVSIENSLALLAADEPNEETFSDPDLLRALNRLPIDQRQMLELRYVVGLSTKETADAIGKSEVATRVALSRAFTKLKGILRAELGMTGPESALDGPHSPDAVDVHDAEAQS